MSKVLVLLLVSFLTFGCSIPITYEAMQEPLVEIAEYDQYFLNLQRTATMLGQAGFVDQETDKDFIIASNGAYAHYIKAHTALASGKIKQFKKYMEAAYKVLKHIEEGIGEIMEEMTEQHPRKGKSGV